MLFPQKRRPAPLYFSSAAHCILYFDKDLAHEGCFRPTSPASAIGLVAANDGLVGANEMQTNGDEGPAQSAREKMRATPLNGMRECRKNISSSVYNRTSVRVGR